MEKVRVNGYDYDWLGVRSRFDAIKESFPRAMAVTAQKFFVDSFRRQGWYEAKTLSERFGKVVQENYERIKAEASQIVAEELKRIKNDPVLCKLLPEQE